MSNPEPSTPAPQPSEEALFTAALKLPLPARPAFLEAACRGRATLRRRLEALLAAHEREDALPALPLDTARLAARTGAPEDFVGRAIGRYRLIEPIGEGGCGVVYVAEQIEPVRRLVALKLIKLGMDSRQVVARFEAERQALALMDHPNIAKVFDGGSTEDGRPYFVMELVRGARITEYCDEHKLTTRERIILFIQVCQAVQHAHQKGVIHRDLKPSNVLVTTHDGVAVPKVIDFGISKAVGVQPLAGKTVQTALNQFIGTPAYMSPEQADVNGRDIDTRSDIYSMGVLLYELLTGRTPFDSQTLLASGFEHMLRIIREQDPPRPSSRLSTLDATSLTTVASARQSEPPRLLNLVRGDLDWIAMKCLEKDRGRRYDTVTGLARDLGSYLRNEPIVARPPSSIYRLQKLIGRNRLAFQAGIIIAVVLVLGTIVSIGQAVRATRAKREALAARQLAETAELTARQRAYGSEMVAAGQTFAARNLGRAWDLLNQQQPEAGQPDLRGWEWRYLWNQVRSDGTFIFPSESAATGWLDVSPDGKWLAVEVTHGGGLSVKNLQTRAESFRLASNETAIKAAFSPTEPWLAVIGTTVTPTGDWHASLRLRNLDTGQTKTLPVDAAMNMGLVFAKDGKTLLTSTARDRGNLELTLWRMPAGTKLAAFPKEHFGSPVWASHLAATADLSLAAYTYGAGPQRICVKNLRTGRELWTAEAALQYVSEMAFSPDGNILASGTYFGKSDIELWDAVTGAKIGRLAGHSGWINSLVFSPDGRKLFSCGGDQTIRVWDVAKRECVDILRGHRREVNHLALLPDGHTLASSGGDGLIGLWDTSTLHPRSPIIEIPGDVLLFGFAPDGHSLVTLNSAGQVARWAGPDFQVSAPLFEIGSPVSRGFLRECFSNDGRFFATGSSNGVIRVWDVARGALIHQWTNTSGEVIAARILAGGQKLITWSPRDYAFHECDAATGRDFFTWPLPKTWRRTMAISPDERFSVSFDNDGGAVLKNLADGRERKLDLRAPESIRAVFSPDGKLLAANCDPGSVRVWSTSTWQPVATVCSFLAIGNGLAFSPDGRRLIISTDDGNQTAKIFATAGWQEVFDLGSTGSGSNDLTYSPDSNVLGWLRRGNVLCLARAPSWEEINAAGSKEETGVTGLPSR